MSANTIYRGFLLFCFGCSAALSILVVFSSLVLRDWESLSKFAPMAFLQSFAYYAIKAGYMPFGLLWRYNEKERG